MILKCHMVDDTSPGMFSKLMLNVRFHSLLPQSSYHSHSLSSTLQSIFERQAGSLGRRERLLKLQLCKMKTKFLIPIDIPQEHYQNSTVPGPVSRSQYKWVPSKISRNVRCGSTQNLMPLRSREHRQNRREQKRAHEQDRYTHSGRMVIEFAIRVFHQIIEQVDRNYEERNDHERDE